MLETYIPSKYKKVYDKSKILALNEENYLYNEAMAFAESNIPKEQKKKFQKAKKELDKKFKPDKKADPMVQMEEARKK